MCSFSSYSFVLFFFFKQKTAYELRISDWSSDVCSSDLTTVLVAVFLPVGFMEGNTGRLFRELSVALAGAVALSAFVALTLTPMMASKLVRPHAQEKSPRVNRWFNSGLDRVARGYSGALARSEEHTSELQSLMRTSSAVFCLNT